MNTHTSTQTPTTSTARLLAARSAPPTFTRVSAPSIKPALKAGTHVARCCGWVDLGTQPAFQEGKPQRRVLLTFLITGAAGETWRVSREYTLGFGPRCGLRKMLEAWRGKPYASDAEAKRLDPLRVLEQPALVAVRYKDGSTWPLLESVMPMLHGLQAEPLRWPPRYFTLVKPDRETFLALPAWVQRKIRASAEWSTLRAPAH